jgi:hypothetical protein
MALFSNSILADESDLQGIVAQTRARVGDALVCAL